MHLMARLHAMTAQQLSQAARIAGVEQDAAHAARASGTSENHVVSLQLLEQKADARRAEVVFHPVVLLLALGLCPQAAYAKLEETLAALIAVASSQNASDIRCFPESDHGTSAAVASFSRLLSTADASGSSGGKIAAAAAMRTFLFIGNTLDTVRRLAPVEGSNGADIWSKTRVSAVEAAGAALEDELLQSKAFLWWEASAAKAAEAQAFFHGGVDVVASALDEIDAGCGGTDGSVSGLQMMAPADWHRGRRILSTALGRPAPPALHARAPRVLIVAGSDCSGGAGIQADIKACQANGAYAMTAISALTAQNTLGVQGVMGVPGDFLEAQILSCLSDIHADVIKTGMLGKRRAWPRPVALLALQPLPTAAVLLLARRAARAMRCMPGWRHAPRESQAMAPVLVEASLSLAVCSSGGGRVLL